MNIANPIYDGIFKLLMSNARIARFFIGTIIGETVVEVEYRPQELPYDVDGGDDLPKAVTIFRLDFVATIKTAGGEHKKIIIEVQKTKKFADILRFRGYLGGHYRREDMVMVDGELKKMSLPIIPIYLLGFKFARVQAIVMKVGRHYTDVLTEDPIYEKEEFMELLTHDSYAVQLPRITGKLQTRLEQMLSFFEQKYFIDETKMIKEYNYPIGENDEEMKLVASTLRQACSDPMSIRMMEAEQAAERSLENELEIIAGDVMKENRKFKLEIEDKEKKIESQDREIAELKRRLGL